MKIILSLLLIIFLTACQSGASLIRSDGHYFEAKSQATIEILQPLRVSPDSARAFLQYGELQSQGRISLYEINCEVEINTVSEQEQIIEPGVFRVMSVIQDQSPIVLLKSLQMASLKVSWGDDDSPVDIMRYYRFYLKPVDKDSSSQVRAVTCRGVQDTPFEAELPTIQEMQAASGPYLKFNL